MLWIYVPPSSLQILDPHPPPPPPPPPPNPPVTELCLQTEAAAAESLKMVFLLHWFYVGVALLSLAPPPTASFSRGASPASCRGMTPNHIRAHPQDSRQGYVTVHTSASSYLPGQLVTVTVRSSRDFMGFLLQARSVGAVGLGVGAGNGSLGGDPVLLGGSWALTPPGAHTLHCLSEDDTVTHSDKQLKRNLSFVWRAPDTPIGDVRFYITVVQSYFVYWAGIKSAVLHDGSVMKKAKATFTIPVPPVLRVLQDSDDDQKETNTHLTQTSPIRRSTQPHIYTSMKSPTPVTGVALEERSSSSMKTFRKSTSGWTEETRTHPHTEDLLSSLPVTIYFPQDTEVNAVSTRFQNSSVAISTSPPSSLQDRSHPNPKSPAPFISPQASEFEITTVGMTSIRRRYHQTHQTKVSFQKPKDLIQELESLISLTEPKTSPPQLIFQKSTSEPSKVKVSSPNPILPSRAHTLHPFSQSGTAPEPTEVSPLSNQSRNPLTSPAQTLLLLIFSSSPRPPSLNSSHQVSPDTSTTQTEVKVTVTQRDQFQSEKLPETSRTFPQPWTKPLSSETPEGEGEDDLMLQTSSETASLAAASSSSSSTNVNSSPSSKSTSSSVDPTVSSMVSRHPTILKQSSSSTTNQPDTATALFKLTTLSLIDVPVQQPSVQNSQPSSASTIQPSVQNSQPSLASSVPVYQLSVQNSQPSSASTVRPSVQNSQPSSASTVKPSVQNSQPSLVSTVPVYQPSTQNSQSFLASTIPPVTSSRYPSGLPSPISSTSSVSPFTYFQLSSSSASSLLSVSSSTSPVPPVEDRPGPSPAPRRSLNTALKSSLVPLPSEKPTVRQSLTTHHHVSTPDYNLKPTTSRPAVHLNPKPHPNLKLNPGHEAKPNRPNSKTKPPAETPEKEGKYPEIVPRHSDWELGMLLGCSAGLGMALVVAVRYVYRKACGKQTQVTLNDREREYPRGDRGLIHVQECGDLVRVRKFRENSFVLLAEYDILATPTD